MKRSISLISLALFLTASATSMAQSNAVTVRNIASTTMPETVEDINKLTSDDNYELPWEQIMESDIAWKKRVWRHLDMKDGANKAFLYNEQAPKEQDLTHILIQGFFDGKYKAYSGDNDRFTHELTKEEMIALISPNNRGLVFNPTKVAGYHIKEDWIYVTHSSKVVTSLVGVAPLMVTKKENGESVTVPAFWIYYPDAREYLAAHKPSTGTSENWDKVFVNRKFTADLDKIHNTKLPAQEK